MTDIKKTPGTGGNVYVPYDKRLGAESTVYFTKDLSADGLCRIFSRVKESLTGNIAIKLHT